MSETVMMVEALESPAAQPGGENGRGAERARTVRQQSARLQAAFVHALTESDVEAIARKLIEQARNGDNTSARLVLKYGFGQLLSQKQTDWVLESEAKAALNVPYPATTPAASPPTPEQVMAAIHMKMQEQQALEADILRMGRPGGPPPGDRRPGTPPGTAKPAGGGRR